MMFHSVPMILCILMSIMFSKCVSVMYHSNNNNDDETNFENLLTNQQKTALTEAILYALGLPTEVMTVKPKIIPSRRRSAPNFLYKIYMMDNNKLKQDELLNVTQEFYLTNAYKSSDVIISFMAQSHCSSQSATVDKPDRVKRMCFDVTSIAPDDILKLAELRLYRHYPPTKTTRKYRGNFDIAVYRVLHDENGEKTFSLIDKTTIDANYHGWIVLSVTSALNHWTKYPEDNRGIYINITAIDGVTLSRKNNIKPETIGIVGFDGAEELQPFMTGFYNNARKNQLRFNIQDILRRYRRTPAITSLHGLLKKRRSVDVDDYYSSCGLRHLYVKFSDINWGQWIIAPKGYNAYHCAGECKYPLLPSASGRKVTKHALIQAAMHHLDSTIPAPCCAPASLSHISVLYFYNENDTRMKRYTNMIASSCSCQ